MIRTALITGATSGIGEATARLFAKNNINLILCGRRKEKLASLENELKSLIDLRLNSLIRRHYTKQFISCEEILPLKNKKNEDTLKFIPQDKYVIDAEKSVLLETINATRNTITNRRRIINGNIGRLRTQLSSLPENCQILLISSVTIWNQSVKKIMHFELILNS